jgi:hypothetical protein
VLQILSGIQVSNKFLSFIRIILFNNLQLFFSVISITVDLSSTHRAYINRSMSLNLFSVWRENFYCWWSRCKGTGTGTLNRYFRSFKQNYSSWSGSDNIGTISVSVPVQSNFLAACMANRQPNLVIIFMADCIEISWSFSWQTTTKSRFRYFLISYIGIDYQINTVPGTYSILNKKIFFANLYIKILASLNPFSLRNTFYARIRLTYSFIIMLIFLWCCHHAIFVPDKNKNVRVLIDRLLPCFFIVSFVLYSLIFLWYR